MSDLLKADEVAVKLKVSEPTLRLWRSKGKGPKFIKMSKGIIRYSPSDIEDYLKSKTFGGACEAL